MKKNLLLTALIAAALVMTGCYKKTSEPVIDEMGFAMQVISALANDNEAFFQEHLITIDDFDELFECESLQKVIKDELDRGQTIEDLKKESIEDFKQYDNIKGEFHDNYLRVQSDLRSKGIDLKKLKITKCHAENVDLTIELEGDGKIYEFEIEAVKLSTRWVIVEDIGYFYEKATSR